MILVRICRRTQTLVFQCQFKAFIIQTYQSVIYNCVDNQCWRWLHNGNKCQHWKTPNDNMLPMECGAQLTWRYLFTPPVSGGRFWPISRSYWASFCRTIRVHLVVRACKITSYDWCPYGWSQNWIFTSWPLLSLQIGETVDEYVSWCNSTSVYVQRSWFSPRRLTHRQTRRQFWLAFFRLICRNYDHSLFDSYWRW